MKKGEVSVGTITKSVYPDKGIIVRDDGIVTIKHAVPGRTVEYIITKRHGDRAEGRVKEVITMAPSEVTDGICEHHGECGGCLYQTVPYDVQLSIKEGQIRELLTQAAPYDYLWEGILRSPIIDGYRNKMEFSWGDAYKGGPLSLGMHKRGSHYDIVTTDKCKLVHEDIDIILRASLNYFTERDVDFYHKMSREGFLRHLLVRRGVHSGEVMIDLITTSRCSQDKDTLLDGWKEHILSQKISGRICGVLHTTNDSLADAVIDQGTETLYGSDEFYETLLGLKFKITPFSFFQTNSPGAEVLYKKIGDYIGETEGKTVFDLYSGTGTIAQLLASRASKVVGVEIVEEAVRAARDNAIMNHIDNCEFIAGDVLKVVGELPYKPDIIVLDPPRDGIHPKALPKIIDFDVPEIIYVSCKPSSLARDLPILYAGGYKLIKACAVDMFPYTPSVEAVALLSKQATV